jgi:hypothetical protein
MPPVALLNEAKAFAHTIPTVISLQKMLGGLEGFLLYLQDTFDTTRRIEVRPMCNLTFNLRPCY